MANCFFSHSCLIQTYSMCTVQARPSDGYGTPRVSSVRSSTWRERVQKWKLVREKVLCGSRNQSNNAKESFALKKGSDRPSSCNPGLLCPRSTTESCQESICPLVDFFYLYISLWKASHLACIDIFVYTVHPVKEPLTSNEEAIAGVQSPY
ncbi:uncharacterized protein [Aristolochia californica]|uniref:uncharacterized protein isoform X2 n=1 Tax=Aristolochia californica TaxID=171875 RepID=UPI0035D75369